MTMIFGGNTAKNVTNQQSFVLYKNMLKQLMARIKNKQYQAKHIDVNILKDNKSKQDAKQFKEVIEMLKNQPYNPSKVALTGLMLNEILKMALDKQSFDQFQKSFKMKYQKYIQNSFLIQQIMASINLIKERIITLDITFKKLNCDSIEKVPKEIENLSTKVSYYQKIISELSQFQKKNQNKMPQLLNNKKNQILSSEVQKQIENMYMANNILSDISLTLERFREKQIISHPKQLNDMLITNITNPLAKVINIVMNQTSENNKNKEFLVDKSIQSPNIHKSSSISQQKWKWMMNLLSKVHNRQNLTNVECKQAFFQSTEIKQMKILLNDLRLNKTYFLRLVHMTRLANQIIYKNQDEDYKLKSYSPQTIFDSFEPLFDVALRVCEQISKLPIVLKQKNIYKEGNASILDQFKIIENNIKGQTQSWYYQLALQLAQKLNLFANKDELTYENMAKERKRFILKIEQMAKKIQKYSASVNKHTSLYQNNNRLEQCSITPRIPQSSSIINKISYLFGGKSSQIYALSNEDLQLRLIETISKNQSLQSEANDLRYQNLKKQQQNQLMEAQLRNIEQKGIKQIEQLTPANKQGRKPIIKFKTTLQMFNRLIYLKNQKIKFAQNDKKKSFLRQMQLISMKQEMQKQNSNNLWQIGNKDKQIQKMNAENIKIYMQNLGLKQKIQKMNQQFLQKLKKHQEDQIIRTNQLINKQNQLINKQKLNDNLMKQLQKLKTDKDPQQNINQLHSNIYTAHIQLSISEDKQQVVVSNQANDFQVIGHSAQMKIDEQKIRQLQKTISNERKWRLSAEERAKQQINKFESAQRQSKSLRQIITKLQCEIASLQFDLTNQKVLFNQYKQQQKKQIQICNKNIIDCTDCYQKQIEELKQNHTQQILYHKNAYKQLQKQIETLVAQERKDKQCQLSKLGYISQLKLQMQNKQTQFKAQIQRQREQQRNYIKTLQQQQRKAKQSQLRMLQTSKNAQIQQKIKQIEDGKAQKAQLQGRIAELQKQHESIQLQLQKSWTEQKESHKASLIQQKGILQGKLRQLQKQLLFNKTQHEKKIQLQQKKMAQISDEKDRVDDAIKFLQNECDKLDKQLKELKQQNKKLKQDITTNIMKNPQNKNNSFYSNFSFELLNNQKQQEYSLGASFLNCQKCKILQLELSKSKQVQHFEGLQNYEEEISKPFKKRISKLLNEKQQLQKDRQRLNKNVEELQNDNCELEIQIKKLKRESLKQS